jgi:hypothetical protein
MPSSKISREKPRQGATDAQYHTLGSYFQHYNNELFNGKLHGCLIVIGRHKKYGSFFKPRKWKNKATGKGPLLDEINLSPECLGYDDIICPCGNKVWGKPGLHIICGDCTALDTGDRVYMRAQ